MPTETPQVDLEPILETQDSHDPSARPQREGEFIYQSNPGEQSKMRLNYRPIGGPEIGSKNEATRGFNMRGFGMVKTSKGVLRGKQIKVFSLAEKT